jgi:hypothetical protein
MRNYVSLSINKRTRLLLIAAMVAFAFVWPKFLCIPSLENETFSSITSQVTTFDLKSAHKSASNHHASCMAHIAAPSRDLQVTSLESKLLNFLRLQSEEISRNCVAISSNVLRIFELEKPILALSYEIKFLTSSLVIKSTVLLI